MTEPADFDPWTATEAQAKAQPWPLHMRWIVAREIQTLERQGKKADGALLLQAALACLNLGMQAPGWLTLRLLQRFNAGCSSEQGWSAAESFGSPRAAKQRGAMHERHMKRRQAVHLLMQRFKALHIGVPAERLWERFPVNKRSPATPRDFALDDGLLRGIERIGLVRSEAERYLGEAEAMLGATRPALPGDVDLVATSLAWHLPLFLSKRVALVPKAKKKANGNPDTKPDIDGKAR